MKEEGKACVKREERESQIKEKKKAQSKTARERDRQAREDSDERVARFERQILTLIDPLVRSSQL